MADTQQQNVDWNQVLDLALKVVGSMIPEVAQIEKAINDLPNLSDAEKKPVVQNIAQQVVTVAERLTGKDLVNDADVQLAAGGIVDAVVGLRRIAARQAAA